MRLQAYDDNGTMKFRQVSGSQALDSLPVGTTIGTVRTGGVIPNGYLEADGTTFDTAKYPELYSVLGTNTLPELFDHDRRDAEYTNIRSQVGSTVRTAYEMPYDGDVTFTGAGYSQSYCAFHILKADGTTLDWSGQFAGSYDGASAAGGSALFLNKGDKFYATANNSQRGLFIHARFYKQHLLIKAATIGIADIDINTIKGELTYSTEETMTGKTWIDGKPIYRQVITGNSGNNFTVSTEIETLISSYGWFLTSTANTYRPIGVNDSGYVVFPDINISTGVLTMKQVNFSNKPFVLTIEYTKR